MIALLYASEPSNRNDSDRPKVIANSLLTAGPAVRAREGGGPITERDSVMPSADQCLRI